MINVMFNKCCPGFVSAVGICFLDVRQVQKHVLQPYRPFVLYMYAVKLSNWDEMTFFDQCKNASMLFAATYPCLMSHTWFSSL